MARQMMRDAIAERCRFMEAMRGRQLDEIHGIDRCEMEVWAAIVNAKISLAAICARHGRLRRSPFTAAEYEDQS